MRNKQCLKHNNEGYSDYYIDDFNKYNGGIVDNRGTPSLTDNTNLDYKFINLNEKLTYNCALKMNEIMDIFYFIRENIIESILSLLIIIYFSLITGPVISPKYCMPFIPIIIYYQSIAMEKLFFFIYHRNNSQNNY